MFIPYIHIIFLVSCEINVTGDSKVMFGHGGAPMGEEIWSSCCSVIISTVKGDNCPELIWNPKKY